MGINPVPYPQLRILHPRPIIIFLQSRTVREFLILQFLPIIPELILRILRLQRFIGYPAHGEPKGIIMILLQKCPLLILHREIIKEPNYWLKPIDLG